MPVCRSNQLNHVPSLCNWRTFRLLSMLVVRPYDNLSYIADAKIMVLSLINQSPTYMMLYCVVLLPWQMMGNRGDNTDPCVRSYRVPCWLSCWPSSGRAKGCALLQLSCSLFCIRLVTFYEWKYYNWVKFRTLSDILPGSILTQFFIIIWYMLQGFAWYFVSNLLITDKTYFSYLRQWYTGFFSLCFNFP